MKVYNVHTLQMYNVHNFIYLEVYNVHNAQN